MAVLDNWAWAVETQNCKIKFLYSGRIGVDKNSYSLTVQRYSAWQIALPKTEFCDVTMFIVERRAIKSPQEIDYLRKASDIADKTLQVILNRIKPGHSARNCVAMSAKSIISLGGDAG